MIEDEVNVVTRTKNRTLFLERNINCVLKQSYQKWSHIIVNDGGDAFVVDNLVSKYKEAYNGRIKVVHHQASMGMEAASNAAIKASEGQFIAILDDDDSWETSYLEKSVNLLKNKPHPSVAGVITWVNIIKEAAKGDSIQFIQKSPYTRELYYIDFAEIIKNNLFTSNSFVFERKALEKVGHFNSELPVLGDWEFNIRFLNNFEIAVIPEYLSNYHQRPFDKNPSSGNSIFSGRHKHDFYRTIIRNKFLREDLHAGKTGIGVLMALLKDVQATDNKVNQLLNSSLNHRILKQIKSIFGKK